MENNRGYSEPELQKMAAFLRERCERGQYGLTYADQQKKLIKIPWLTVPRQNEDVSENFGMFTEWAYLSFRKRGNRGDQLENEALSAQKHRFRNALARADGLRHVKELSTDTMRVYEFVDTKKEKDHQSKHSPPRYGDSGRANYSQHLNLMLNQPEVTDGVPGEWDSCSPITVTTSPNQTPVYVHPGVQYTMSPQEMVVQAPTAVDREPSLGTLIEEMINTPEPTLPYAQTNGGYTYTVPQPVTMAEASTHMNYAVQSTSLSVPGFPTPSQTNGHHLQLNRQPDLHHLLVKVHFRGVEVLQKPITNSNGFRLYSGHNIPDMRRLLGDEQRNQLQMLTKYPCDELFGPENVDQVEMPLQRESGHRQGARTSQVLYNMDRGVIFVLDYASHNGLPYNMTEGVPNIFAIRLCQTRVFPFDTNVPDRDVLEEEGLKRMQWALVFDGSEFMLELRKWGEGRRPTPSSTVNFSVGQKPKRGNLDCNLVTVSISVTKAKSLIDRYCEEQMEDICISDKNSMDRAAKQHKDEVQTRIQIDDSAVGYVA